MIQRKWPAGQGRLLPAGFALAALCCHATQDKVFVAAPDVPLGWWEYYAVTDHSASHGFGDHVTPEALEGLFEKKIEGFVEMLKRG